ncbi:helix-turn-helix transcriptional regulator [Herbaspirillum sp. NPDC101396]|uniref:S24 family peptidase n=1 Tax=Herbaspirillum sp. NPDC101396 TaxID=3364005 RepID=UPI00383BD0A4
MLALIADRYDGDRQQVCDASGMSESRLAQLLSSSYRGGQGFGEKAARALEERLHLDPLYFDQFAVGEMTTPYVVRQTPKTDADDAVTVRQVVLTLTAGSARTSMQEIAPTLCLWRFPKSWLKAHGLHADKLFAVTVTGAGMAPRLHEGDVVVVNGGDTALQDGAVYLINYRGEAILKRLALDLGRWFMTADNNAGKRYPRLEFDQPDCILLGRVILLASERI